MQDVRRREVRRRTPATSTPGDPLQETYSATQDDSDPPDDSGPITYVTVGNTVGGIVQNTAGVNSLQTGTSTTLFITFKLQGLANSAPSDPPIILRTSVQASKRTGLIDCGQGNGASGDSGAITNGCPHDLAVYNGTACVVTNSANPWTCVDTIPGNRRQKIVQGFTNRIGNACDNWQAYKANGTPIPQGDPRVFILVVTAPNDLSGGNNGAPVRIRAGGLLRHRLGRRQLARRAGHDPGLHRADEQGRGLPRATGSANSQVWGHFIKYVDPIGAAEHAGCVATESAFASRH